MGTYFSNLHIKNESFSESDVKACIVSYFSEKGFVKSGYDNADFEVDVYVPKDSRWTSVYCDAFTYNDIIELCPRVSSISGDDVLGVACFDSDYLFLNLLNVKEDRNLWLNIGGTPELKKPRRSNVAAWKNSVKNINTFSSAAKIKYTFAEDFLLSVQDELEISFEQSTGLGISDEVSKLYFSAPQEKKSSPTKLEIHRYTLSPCSPGQRTACFVYNTGATSRGFAVVFTGNYIENDDITIDNAEFCYNSRGGEIISVPIVFEKCRLSDGQWAYYWENKDFKIPPAVSSDLPPRIRSEKEFNSCFGIRYTPNGNKRKFLDITVSFAPFSNWIEGQCGWRVWARHSSKQEYIEEYNQDTRRCGITIREDTLLDPDDYDLD